MDSVTTSDTDSSGSRSNLGRFLGIRLLALATILGGVYLTRPLWHDLIYSMVYSPGGLVFLGGSALAALVLAFFPPSRLERENGSDRRFSVLFDDEELETLVMGGGTARRKLRIFAVVIGVLFLLALLVSVPAGALEQRTLAQQTMADATELEEFPQANADNPRVVPRQVSDVTTRGSVSYRQHRLGTSDIARMEDGSLGWSYAIEPDGPRNKLLENQRGVLIADMTSMDDRETVVYEEDFEYGEGMYLHRSADWNLKKTDYFSRYDDDAVEFSYDGEPYMYYAKTSHEWHLAPFPHTTPTWDGGALVHPDGTIEHLSPEEARDHEVLEGQRLYPLTLTHAEMDSLGYREGIVNQMPVIGAHEGEVEMANLPEGADNEQPFVIDLEGERMSYVTAMEPFGADTRGLDEVWFADAETGEYAYYGSGAQTLTGPERAMGIARSADSRTNWGQNFVVTEPVPVTIDGSLWWHIKVSPTDFTDVTRNVFVNAETGTAVEIREDAAIREFIRGDVTEDDLDVIDDGDVEPAPDDSNVAYYIIVTDENGDEVDRIAVERGQEVTIVDPEDDRVATANESDS
ncbi:hypothetical protein [Natronosalvus amylolyticus]|uniref:hypothetical protein n=1 Tax=Natronosalvus amylolyticus TaxID=2961994 RepID=UPI0020C9C33E|nr:hypothetical protein [Natronosalvus amylolyticus]